MTQPPASPPPAAPRKPRKSHPVRKLAVIFAVGCVFVAAAVFAPGPLEQPVSIVIPTGASTRDMGDIIGNSGAAYVATLFPYAAKLIAPAGLKAGEYQLTPGESLADILRQIRDGHSVTRLFTVAEGLTSAEVAKLLDAAPTLGGERVAPPAEGSLLPETYRYIYGDSRAGLVARMQKSMQDQLNMLWAERDPNIALQTPEQAVILASIVEKETGKAAERPRIAGVFYNRLKQQMKLQSDPTVIYAITSGATAMDHSVNHADLSFASPYNTYLNEGLPPGPICNPGRASLRAVLHPETNDFLYFVADGTGGHVFSKTLEEHNKNVTKWNLLKSKTP